MNCNFIAIFGCARATRYWRMITIDIQFCVRPELRWYVSVLFAPRMPPISSFVTNIVLVIMLFAVVRLLFAYGPPNDKSLDFNARYRRLFWTNFVFFFLLCKFIVRKWQKKKKHARLLNGGNDSRKNAYTWQSSIARMRFSLISHDFKFTRQIYRGSASARANAWWQTICSPVRRLLAHFQVEFSVTNKPSAQAAYNFHERNMYT